MEKLLLRLSDAFAAAPGLVLRRRWTILTILLAVSAAMAYGVFHRTALDMSMESFLPADDPAMDALNDFREQFGSDDSVFLVYRARDGDVFSRRSLEAARRLTDDLRDWQNLDRGRFPETLDGYELDWDALTHIRRVLSVANLRYQESVGDSLLSNRLVPGRLPEDGTALAGIRDRALALEDFLLAFWSADTEYGAILIQTDFGARPTEDFVPAVDAEGVSLGDAFADFDDAAGGLAFDPSAEVQEVDFEPVDMMEYTGFHIITKAIYQRYEDDLEFFPVGNPALSEFMIEMLDEMQLLGALLVLVFTLLLWILFRSFSAVLWPVITILLSVAWAWGVPAWLGVELTTMISLTVMLIFAVGIADCVHVMSAYFTFRREGKEHHEALSLSYGKVGLAIGVTTVTTMCGVLALTSSDLLMIKVFGWTSALGVFLAFFFTIVLLPILLDIWHPGRPGGGGSLADRLGRRWSALPRRARAAIALGWFALLPAVLPLLIAAYIAAVTLMTYTVVNWQRPILEYVPGVAARRPFLIMAAFGAVFVLCVYGMTRIRIDSNMTEITREGSSIQVTYDTVDEHMAGAQNMEIVVNTRRVDGLTSPRMLAAIDALQTRIERRYPEQITRTHSLADIVKDTNRIMNGGDPAFHRVPDSGLMVSQLLYLFNSANPEDRRAIVSDDYSSSHITVNARNAGSYQYQAFFTEIGEEIEDVFAPLRGEFPELEVNVTGSMAMMMRMADEVARSQYSSMLFALGVISAILIVTLGSLKGGLLAMIPNLIPATLSFGLMGLLGLPLDTDTLLIAPIIIGIAVDDTIHFMTHYRIALARTASISLALRDTVRHVGQAVMFTTMVIALSFAILSFSGHLGMAKMGFFGAIAIFVALLCDLFLIPAMVVVFKPTYGVRDADTSIDFAGAARA